MKTSILSRRLILCCLSLTLFLTACSQVPVTGRRQFNFVPDSMMNSMSFQQYDEFLTKNKLSKNADQTKMVKRVGARIQKAVEQYCAANHIPLEGYKWEFNLVEDPAVNAWAMPGGKVVVYTGILPIAQNDEGLAVVLGHEIAHAIAKHGSERMSQGLVAKMGGAALDAALKEQPELTQKIFQQSYGVVTNVGVILPFSRLHESEADHLGLIFMAMAGYDPHAAVSFWQRMAAEKKGKAPPELLSTHPADEKRIQNLQKLIPEAMKYYKPVPK